MIISHIVAAAKNGSIGLKGLLPWDIPEDVKFFKDATKNRTIIMGRKTYESLGHPLPHRLNVVVTRQKDFHAEKALVVRSIAEGIEICKAEINKPGGKEKYGDEIFIIGGGEIYKQSVDMVDRIYLTRIHKDFPGDAFYPEVDLKKFKEVDRKERTQPIPFTFLTYEKKM